MWLWLSLLAWILVGVTVFLAAMMGGRKQFVDAILGSKKRGVRRLVWTSLAIVYVGFGVAIPVAVISGNKTEEQSGAAAAPAELSAGAAKGKDLFTKTCGGCHTLAAAGTSGQVGPNLDQLKPDLAQVEKALKVGGTGSGRMPPGLYTGQDAKDVAEYVSSVAGK